MLHTVVFVSGVGDGPFQVPISAFTREHPDCILVRRMRWNEDSSVSSKPFIALWTLPHWVMSTFPVLSMSYRVKDHSLQLACGRPPQVPDCRCALVQEGFNRFSQASQVSRWVPEDVPTSSQHVWCCASMSNASRSRTRRKKKIN